MAMTAAPVGPQRYVEAYPAVRESATRARHDASLILATWHLELLTDPIELIVTELVANAVQHGEGSVHFCITRHLTGVRIEVTDSGLRKPSRRFAKSFDEGGRGLLLVDTLATSWGWQECRGGKLVWAELIPESGS